jgi:AcrR family transcriptional regulator
MGEDNNLDLRKWKSQDYLKRSFWRLLEKNGYAKITIKDISEDSGLNRKTFYRNYENIEELMRASFFDLFAELSMPYACFQEKEQITPDLFSQCTLSYIRFIQKEQTRFRLIFKNHLEGFAQVIWKEMFTVSAQDFVMLGPSHAPILADACTLDLYANYAAFSAWGNLEWVLRHVDQPAEELLALTMKACSAYLYNYYVSYQIGRCFTAPSETTH